MKMKGTQSCLTLCDPMGYTVYGIFETKILKWIDFPFYKGSSEPWDRTQVSLNAGGFFTIWDTRESHCYKKWNNEIIRVIHCIWKVDMKMAVIPRQIYNFNKISNKISSSFCWNSQIYFKIPLGKAKGLV